MKQADRIVLRPATAAVFTISLAALAATRTAPNQPAPQQVPQAPQDQTTGQSLSGQLNQTNGVIHPPRGVAKGSAMLSGHTELWGSFRSTGSLPQAMRATGA